MIFNRTLKIKTRMTSDAIREKLLGKKVNIHSLDFEVYDRGNMLKIIPHAENATGLKTLPITHITLADKDAQDVTITVKTKPRRIDIGGPYMIVIFSAFLFLIASGFYILQPKNVSIPIALGGLAVLIVSVFAFKMQTGYYDYVRKIQTFVKNSVQ